MEILFIMKIKFYRIESLFLKKLCINLNGNFDDLFYKLVIFYKIILKSNLMDLGFILNVGVFISDVKMFGFLF